MAPKRARSGGMGTTPGVVIHQDIARGLVEVRYTTPIGVTVAVAFVHPKHGPVESAWQIVGAVRILGAAQPEQLARIDLMGAVMAMRFEAYDAISMPELET